MAFFLVPMDGTTAVTVAYLDVNIVQTRALKRRPAEERWDLENLLKIQACAIQLNGIQSEDQRIRVRAPVLLEDLPEDQLPERMSGQADEAPKRTSLPRRCFQTDQFGFTAHCPSCVNLQRGGRSAISHSEMFGPEWRR